MSENISWQEQLKAGYQVRISERSPLFQYVSEQLGTYLDVEITHSVLLLLWRQLKRTRNISHLELLQISGEHLPFSVKPDTERIEKQLRSLISKVYNKSTGLRGLTMVNFLKKTKSVRVYQHELVNPSSLKLQLEKYKEENSKLKQELHELDSRCEELLQKLLNQNCDYRNMEIEAENACQENIELTKYIDSLEEKITRSNCSEDIRNTGAPLHAVSKRHKNRKIKELKTTAERA